MRASSQRWEAAELGAAATKSKNSSSSRLRERHLLRSAIYGFTFDYKIFLSNFKQCRNAQSPETKRRQRTQYRVIHLMTTLFCFSFTIRDDSCRKNGAVCEVASRLDPLAESRVAVGLGRSVILACASCLFNRNNTVITEELQLSNDDLSNATVSS